MNEADSKPGNKGGLFEGSIVNGNSHKRNDKQFNHDSFDRRSSTNGSKVKNHLNSSFQDSA
jgi:hypothetical protein